MRIIAWGIRDRSVGDQYSNGNDDPGALPGLLSNVLMSSKALAVTHGFEVNYTADGKSRHLINPYTLALCRAKCPASLSS